MQVAPGDVYPDFVQILRRPTDLVNEAPPPEELFSVERLEQYAAHQPTAAVPDSLEVRFAEEKVEFLRRDGRTVTRTEILVSPEDNVELRRISLTNGSILGFELRGDRLRVRPTIP